MRPLQSIRRVGTRMWADYVALQELQAQLHSRIAAEQAQKRVLRGTHLP